MLNFNEMSHDFVTSYCHITPEEVSLNAETWYRADDETFCDMQAFFSSVYERLGVDYRKFFKMDALSKLGFLASELLLTEMDKETPKEDMGIAIINRSASLEADRKYQQTIQNKDDFFPSPAEFVYTLPNIVLGEIAIRNKIHGETAFYLMPKFQMETISKIIGEMINFAGMKQVLVGWVEVDAFSGAFECRMVLAKAASAVGADEMIHFG